ncbi:MAG: fimbrillin family protein, partial [Alistipes sp.]|nr:fimbrillin family protein [Alistipes sp.]
MKKAFVAILSLAALVACSQDVTLQRNDSAAISFDNFIEKKTRVAADPSTTTESLSEFSVWGFRGESSALVLQEERVYKTAEGWVYDNLQYWNEGADYFFAAVSPVKHSQVEVDATGLCKTGLGTITFTNTAAGDVDLIYASKLIDKSDVDASNPEKVKLQFAHLLSKVKFSIAYDFPNALTTVAVKDLKIANSPAVGTIDLTKERANWLWTLPQTGETVTLEFGDIEKGAQFPLVNEYYESDKECLLIPADATRSYTITFMVEVYNNGVLAGEYPKTITLTNRAFVQGKNYNLKTIITPDNIVEGGLKPIEFQVEVEAWDDQYTDVDLDGEQTEEPAEPTVLATPAVKTSVDVNVVTLTWDAVEGAAYYTVQVDDDIAEKVEGTSYVFEGDYAVEYMFTVVAVPAEGENLVASEAAVVTATTEAKPEEPVTPEPTETVLYLQPNANWNVDNARFAAYMWNDAGDTWFDLTLVEGEENIYEFTLPEGYSNLIFCRMNPSATANNWDNKWNQTNDLNVPTDGTNLYTIAEGAWDKGAGTWSTYTPATEEPVEPETPAAGSEITVAKFLEMADTANEFV